MSAAALVVRYLEALSSDDPDAVAELVAPDFRNEHASALGRPSTGREEYRRRLPDFMSMLAGRRYVVDALVEGTDGTAESAADAVCGVTDESTGDTAGDLARDAAAGSREVAVRYRLTARHDGHPIEVPGIMWCTVTGGLITRRIDCWDSLTFLRQADLLPIDTTPSAATTRPGPARPDTISTDAVQSDAT